MMEPFDFDPTPLGELITTRWQEDRGYYSLRHAEPGWLEALWSQRTDHSGWSCTGSGAPACINRWHLHLPPDEGHITL